MLRRSLAALASLCALVALQAGLGSSPAWAAAVGGGVGAGAPAPQLALPATGPDASATAVTGAATTRLVPGIQHSPQQRQSASTKKGSADLAASGDGVAADPFGTCISCTSVAAGSNSSSSTSQGMHVADESVSEGQSPTNGYASGEAVALPANPLLGLVIGRWDSSNRSDHTSSEAHSDARFADLRLSDGQPATVTVFDTRSDAAHTARGSHGSASSDGVTANLLAGSFVLILLHSDADSDSPGHVYVAHLNGGEIMSSKEVGGGVPIRIPNVASITLLSVGSSGAVVGGVSDGKSQEAAGILTSTTGDESRRPA